MPSRGIGELPVLNGATGNVVGEVFNVDLGRKNFALQVWTTSGALPTLGGSVNLEGSLNGTHWHRLAEFRFNQLTNGGIVFVSNAPVAAIRVTTTSIVGVAPSPIFASVLAST